MKIRNICESVFLTVGLTIRKSKEQNTHKHITHLKLFI